MARSRPRLFGPRLRGGVAGFGPGFFRALPAAAAMSGSVTAAAAVFALRAIRRAGFELLLFGLPGLTGTSDF